MNLKQAIKTYGIINKLSNYQGSYLLPNGQFLDLDDNGHRNLGIYNFTYKTNSLRVRNTPNNFSVDLHKEFIPSSNQWDSIEFLAYNKELRVTILDIKENILYSGIVDFKDLKIIYRGVK